MHLLSFAISARNVAITKKNVLRFRSDPPPPPRSVAIPGDGSYQARSKRFSGSQARKWVCPKEVAHLTAGLLHHA